MLKNLKDSIAAKSAQRNVLLLKEIEKLCNFKFETPLEQTSLMNGFMRFNSSLPIHLWVTDTLEMLKSHDLENHAGSYGVYTSQETAELQKINGYMYALNWGAGLLRFVFHSSDGDKITEDKIYLVDRNFENLIFIPHYIEGYLLLEAWVQNESIEFPTEVEIVSLFEGLITIRIVKSFAEQERLQPYLSFERDYVSNYVTINPIR